MVEVFKTNVEDPVTADKLLHQIHAAYAGYEANFDLDDCDRILRVECSSGNVSAAPLIDMLKMHGFEAEQLQ